MKFLVATLITLTLFSSCKKNDEADNFNLSATTWKGSHVSGGGNVNETYVFDAGGNFVGATDLNGQPQAMTGTWTQDGLKVSVSNVTIKTYGGIFRIQLEISSDHSKMTGAVNSTSNSTTWNVNLTKQ